LLGLIESFNKGRNQAGLAETKDFSANRETSWWRSCLDHWL
jgi:hypothetical protein